MFNSTDTDDEAKVTRGPKKESGQSSYRRT